MYIFTAATTLTWFFQKEYTKNQAKKVQSAIFPGKKSKYVKNEHFYMCPTEKCEKWPKSPDFCCEIPVFAPILGVLVKKRGFGDFRCHGYTTEPSAPPARRKNFWGVFQAMRAKLVDVF